MTNFVKGTADSENPIESSPGNPTDSTPSTQQVHSTAPVGTPVKAAEADEKTTKDPATNVSIPQEALQVAGSNQPDASKKPQRLKSEKPVFQTIEQFIEYAY